MNRSKTFGAALLVAAATLAPALRAAEIAKAGNTTALNATGSWVGGILPGVNDIIVWNSTLTGANTSALGGNLSVLGLKVTNPSGAITVSATTGATLTIGSGGIDMSQATQNLALSPNLAIGANQNWVVAGGRTLTGIAGASTSVGTGTGNINITRSSVVGFDSGIAAVLFNANGNGTGWTGYSGNVTIGANVKVQTQGNAAAALGSGVVTLAGGAVHQTSGSWTFGNNFNVTANSVIGQDSSNGVGRLFKLLGDLGSGNGSGITFTNTVTGGTRTDNVGIILAGVNASTYGATTISANTRLRVGGNAEATIAGTGLDAGNRGSLGTGAVTLSAATSELGFTRNDVHTVSNAISGSGTVVIGGNTANLAGTASQVVTLSGASTYTGATRVSRSRLNLTGSLTSAITVDNAGLISGTGGTTGLLTLSSGAGIALAGGSTTTSLTVNGATFGGSNLVAFLGAATAATAYDVFTYGNGAVTGIANLTVAWRGTLSDDTANKKYIFTAGSSGTRTWNTTTGTWEQNGAANFAEGDQKFFGGDDVVFGDIASDSAITLAGAIAPGSVTVSNAANTYTFSGTSISGASGLSKSGSGTLVLSAAHAYSGGTTLSAGTVRIGNAAALGGGAVTISGGTLDIAGLAPANVITLGGSGNGTDPALWNSATTGVTLAGAITLASDASVGNGSTSSTSLLTLGSLDLNGRKLTISSGAVSIAIGAIDDGDIEVASGGTLYSLSGGSLTAASGTITVKAGGRMETRDTNNSAMTSVHGIVLDGGTLSTAVITNNNGGGAGTILKNGITVTSAGGALVGNNTSFAINLRLAGALSGSGNLEIAGAQGVELRGDATNYTGTATVTAGTLTFNSAVDQGFGGAIAGTRPVVKSGAGTLTLLGANSYSGNTTINAGSLKFDSSATQSLAGAVSGAGNLAKVGNGTLTLSGVASLSGNVTVDGGTLVLANDNTLTGAVTVSSGTLQLGGGATTGFIGNSATVTNNSRIVWNRSSDTVVGNAISGTGSLVNEGAGVVSLNGANTYSGTTTITSGTVRVGNAGTTGVLGSGEVINNSALVFNRSDAIEVANVISGTGSVTKLGVSSVTLTGVSSYSGATSVSNGALLIGASGSLGDTAVGVASGATFGGSGSVAGDVILASGATLAPGIASVGTLSVGSLTLGAAAGDLATILMTVAADGSLGSAVSVTGDILANGGAESVSIAFGSNLALLAAGTYSLVNYSGVPLADLSAFKWTGVAGARQSLALNNAPGVIELQVGNAYVRWSGSQGASWSAADNWTLSSNASPDAFLSGDVAVFDDSASSGAVSIDGGSVNASTVTFSGQTLAYSLTSSDGSGIVAASLVKEGAATVTLSTANTISDSSRISGGTLVLGDAGALGASSVQLATGGSLDINGFTFANGVVLQGGGVVGAGTLAGVISGSSALVRDVAGVLIVAGANTFSGGTSVSAGTLRLGNAAALGSGAVAVTGGTLDVAGFAMANALTLSGVGDGSTPALWNSASTLTSIGSVTLASGASVGNSTNDKNTTLNLGATNLAGNTLTIASGAVSINIRNFSSGDIIIANGGTLYTDNGTNTYAAPTGTITINAGGRMETRDTDNTAQTSSHTIALNGGTLSTAVLANNNGGGAGTILRNAITVDATNGGSIVGNNTAFALNLRLTGSISGSGALDIGGSQGVELRGDATAYTGVATVSNGTLTLNTSTSQGFGGSIGGSRPLVKSGAGTTSLLAANAISGTVTVNAGTLALSGAGALASASSVSLSVSGASLDISAAASSRTLNNLSGVAGTTINLGSNTLTVASSSATTITGVVSGDGSFGKTGAATLTLAGANTFSGGFTLGEGVVSAQNNAAFGSGALTALGGTLGRNAARTLANNIAVDGSLSLGGAGQDSGNLALNGVISGAGTLTNLSGITILSGANTFSGRLEIQGTAAQGWDVVLNNLNALGGAPDLHMTGGRLILATQFVGQVANIGNLSGTGGIINTQYGATQGTRTLGVNQSDDAVFAGVLTDGGGNRNLGLIKDGEATLELSGANPFSGGVDIRGGTLRLGLATSVGTGVVTLTGGALDINGLTFGNAIAAAGGSIAGSGTVTGIISGNGGVVAAPTGTLTLSATNTFSGGLELASGTLVAGNASAFGTGDILLSAGILDFNNLDVLNRVIFAGGTLVNVRTGGAVAIDDSLTAEQINALDIPAIAATSGTNLDLTGVTKDVIVTGSATLTGLSTYTGALAVSGGTLDLSDAANRPAAAAIELRAGGTLDFGSTAFTGNVTYKGGAVTGSFAGNLNVSGAVSITSANVPSGKVVVTTGNSVGLASGFGGTVRLEGGSVTSGIDTFAGTVELGAAGALNLTTELATSAAVVVDDGGVLRGTGTVASLTVASGGLLAPGNSPGMTTTTGNLVLLGGGALDLEILATGGEIFAPVAGADYDSVTVGGDLDLTGLSLGNRFLINVISLLDPTNEGQVTDFDPALTKVYDVYTYGGQLLKTYAGSATDLFQLDTSAFTFEGAALDPLVFSLVHNTAENKIQLVYAPIPEPSTYGLILGGLALAGAAVRRRRKSAK